MPHDSLTYIYTYTDRKDRRKERCRRRRRRRHSRDCVFADITTRLTPPEWIVIIYMREIKTYYETPGTIHDYVYMHLYIYMCKVQIPVGCSPFVRRARRVERMYMYVCVCSCRYIIQHPYCGIRADNYVYARKTLSRRRLSRVIFFAGQALHPRCVIRNELREQFLFLN